MTQATLQTGANWPRILVTALAGMTLAGVLAAAGLMVLLWHFGRDLPDYKALANYQPPVVSRVFAEDGALVAEFAREKRLFAPIDTIPKTVIEAFLSAEDQRFYDHGGLDYWGILRAVFTNAGKAIEGGRPVGASTITQQVAKNFLTGNEVSYRRKIREAILAWRIEHAFTKNQILELYLNEIYLGAGAYGVASAAQVYFGKPLAALDVAEAAYLAALPKAPNNYHPVRRRAAALARRNWVIDRMRSEGYVTREQADAARADPFNLTLRGISGQAPADYFAEEVRQTLAAKFGERALYEGGLSVRSTLDPKLQDVAVRVLRQGLIGYDEKHGWRGPLAHFDSLDQWRAGLRDLHLALGVPGWQAGVVLQAGNGGLKIGLGDGSTGALAPENMAFARGQKPGVGDVILVETQDGHLRLRQIPEISGAFVAMDPHTGRVLAMVGGFDFASSKFNRATQAKRQPGSAFKPFVYAAALDNGFTPSSLVLDAPFAISDGAGGQWKPENYDEDYLGPTTLRVGLEKSRNLMTVRLAQRIGMKTIAAYARNFGVTDNLPGDLTASLGSGETTVLQMVAAYGEFVNGGKKITPTLIDRIQDRRGKTVFLTDARPCLDCRPAAWANQTPPELTDDRPQVISPQTAYQIVNLLQGVVERGTATAVRAVGKPLAGKTGTTNDSNDAWFIGFSPDLVAGVYMGFDQPKSLGERETGGSLAAPIFRDFMKTALADVPAIPFRQPPGIRLVYVNARSGEQTYPGAPGGIWEAFKPGSEPGAERDVLDGSEMLDGGAQDAAPMPKGDANINQGTGGLY